MEGEGAQPDVRRWQRQGGQRFDLPPLCAQCDGYNLHAGTVIEENDREGLERLGRYLLRPRAHRRPIVSHQRLWPAVGRTISMARQPPPQERLQRREDGMLALKLRKPWSDGSVELLLSPLDLLARLAALVSRPGKNAISTRCAAARRAGLVRHMARSSWRKQVIPPPPQKASFGILTKKGAISGKRRPWRHALVGPLVASFRRAIRQACR